MTFSVQMQRDGGLLSEFASVLNLRRGAVALRGPSCAGSRANQRPNPHEVVHRCGEGENPAHFVAPSVPQRSQQSNHLAPAEPFLHQFSFSLTDLVPGMARRPLVDRATWSSSM